MQTQKLHGMTLVEALAAISILAVCSLLTYTGICTGANLRRRGDMLRQADAAAVLQLETAMQTRNGSSTVLVPVTLVHGTQVLHTELSAQQYRGTDAQGQVSYVCYLAEEA